MKRLRTLLFLLTFLLLPLILGSWRSTRSAPVVTAFTPGPRLEWQDVAANETSRMIYCRLHLSGVGDVLLTEAFVNDVLIKTGDTLPILLQHGQRYIFTFRYDGPWEGSIEVVLRTARYVYPRLVNLEVASKNSVEQVIAGASSRDELLSSFIDDFLNVAYESLEARSLVAQAKARWTDTQDAYNRGDYEKGSQLAVACFNTAMRAKEVEKNYQVLKAQLLVIGAFALVAAVLIIEARRGRKHPLQGPRPQASPERVHAAYRGRERLSWMVLRG